MYKTLITKTPIKAEDLSSDRKYHVKQCLLNDLRELNYELQNSSTIMADRYKEIYEKKVLILNELNLLKK